MPARRDLSAGIGRPANQPLEHQLTDILAALLLAGPLLVQQRRDREEAERRRRLDDNRWRRFVELGARWNQADEVRRFLAVLEQHPDVAKNLADGTPIAEWLSWARERLAAFDPLAAGPAGVFGDLPRITSWTYL
jgi:hypothetical protein